MSGEWIMESVVRIAGGELRRTASAPNPAPQAIFLVRREVVAPPLPPPPRAEPPVSDRVVTLYDKRAGLCNAECPVCYLEFDERTRVLNWPCAHALCEPCGLRWVAHSNHDATPCPVCRHR